VPIEEAICEHAEWYKNRQEKKEKDKKNGGEDLGYSSGLRKLESGSGYCLRLPISITVKNILAVHEIKDFTL
jgi:hypothetical protein